MRRNGAAVQAGIQLPKKPLTHALGFVYGCVLDPLDHTTENVTAFGAAQHGACIADSKRKGLGRFTADAASCVQLSLLECVPLGAAKRRRGMSDHYTCQKIARLC
jgi:hypothetical protein